MCSWLFPQYLRPAGEHNIQAELCIIRDVCMGERSQRYSMLVKDGTVTQLNIEQGGEFKVSSAEHLLAQL